MASFSVSSSVKKAKKDLTRQQRKQIPFALSNTLNELAFDVRKAEQNYQRQKVDSPTPFTQKGFQVKKSNKRSLVARVQIPPNRWSYLQKIARGGQSSRPGKRHAVPINSGLVNKYGNLPRNKARTLARRKDHFIATINGREGVWKRDGKRRLSLQMVFKQTTTVPKSYVPWVAARRIVDRRSAPIFDKKLKYALRTAR